MRKRKAEVKRNRVVPVSVRLGAEDIAMLHEAWRLLTRDWGAARQLTLSDLIRRSVQWYCGIYLRLSRREIVMAGSAVEERLLAMCARHNHSPEKEENHE